MDARTCSLPVRGRQNPRPDRALRVVLAVALLFRLVLSTQTIVHHPDEVWQYLEPAYGLVTGRWIVAWEYHEHIRGWLVPMMLYPMMALGHALAPATPLHIWLVRLALSIASLSIVAAFYAVAARVSRRHALIAAWVAAIWVEIFYFAPLPSGEAIAATLLLPAIALLHRLRDRPDLPTAITAGCLLGLGGVVRFQYLPAIALIAIWSAWGQRRRQSWLGLLAGIALALSLGALADALAGQVPFLWIDTNYAINMAQNRSAFFGTTAPTWYVSQILATWGWCALILVPAIAVGTRRLPMLLVMALVVIGFHMAVPHKEYRFVLLAVMLLMLLAAIGTVDLADWLDARFAPGRLHSPPMLPLLLALWFAMSLTVALSKPFSGYWGQGHAAMNALADAGRRPDICGLAEFRPDTLPRLAHVYLNRDIPVLLFDGPVAAAAAAANAPRFNVAIASYRDAVQLPPGYALDHCTGSTPAIARQRSCIYVRSGKCNGGAGDFDYNLVLTRMGH